MTDASRLIRQIAKIRPESVEYMSIEARRIVFIGNLKYPGDETAEKTEASYFRQLWSRVLALYRGELPYTTFIGDLADIIQQQITRAWRQALRDEGLDPNQANPGGEFADEVEAAILSEYDHVDKFAADIRQAGFEQSSYEPLRVRAEMWASRYTDAYNKATLEIQTQLGGKLAWRLGKTEEHCETCAALDGLVAFATEWQAAGFRPQNPPNALLECGGWQCDCKLETTDARRSPKVLDKLLSIAVSRNI